MMPMGVFTLTPKIRMIPAGWPITGVRVKTPINTILGLIMKYVSMLPFIFALALAGCDRSPLEGAAAEEAAYRSCTACHGATGLGNRGMQAPALVNLDDWYVRRQLMNFKNGIRGRHSKDIYGMQMASQASLLSDEPAVEAVIRRIDSFPNKAPLATLQADAAAGARQYAQHCSACHGPEGEGYADLGAPSLRGIDDWYLVRQYENFRDGIRGNHKDDLYGQQMLPMGQLLTDEQVRDVVVWLQSLGLVPHVNDTALPE